MQQTRKSAQGIAFINTDKVATIMCTHFYHNIFQWRSLTFSQVSCSTLVLMLQKWKKHPHSTNKPHSTGHFGCFHTSTFFFSCKYIQTTHKIANTKIWSDSCCSAHCPFFFILTVNFRMNLKTFYIKSSTSKYANLNLLL